MCNHRIVEQITVNHRVKMPDGLTVKVITCVTVCKLCFYPLTCNVEDETYSIGEARKVEGEPRSWTYEEKQELNKELNL